MGFNKIHRLWNKEAFLGTPKFDFHTTYSFDTKNNYSIHRDLFLSLAAPACGTGKKGAGRGDGKGH